MLISLSARAYDLPPLNLGYTSFLDGAPPAGPGWYFQQYVQFFNNGEFQDGSGNSLPPEIDVTSGISQLVYQSDKELLFGGKWGVNLMLPIAGFDLEPDDSITNSTGLGDLLVGPFLQWDPIMGKKGPKFMHRIELQMIFPTGKYSQDKAVNPGSNHFSFNPYWAGTYFLNPEWSASWRLHYLWNGKNEDPYRPLGVSDVRAGQAVHVNFATAYEVLPKRLRLGINGYYLKQTTDTEINGMDVSGRREQVLGIGPGLVYHVSPHTHLFLNAYFESNAENRPEGSRLNFRFVHHFN
ncbi:MAG: phenol degradation protein meta [Gammaproteobacteria bacterium]|nr:phenol degradation protein meta [Gammaproteobacteria bacterium]